MPEMIDLSKFILVRGMKSFCKHCGGRVALLYEDAAGSVSKAGAYFLCPRCNCIAQIGAFGGIIRTADPEVLPLKPGEIDPYEEELMESIEEGR